MQNYEVGTKVLKPNSEQNRDYYVVTQADKDAGFKTIDFENKATGKREFQVIIFSDANNMDNNKLSTMAQETSKAVDAVENFETKNTTDNSVQQTFQNATGDNDVEEAK